MNCVDTYIELTFSIGSCTQSRKRRRCCKQQLDPRIDGRWFLAGCISDRKIFIFQGMEFFVTGFSICKEREIEGLIQRHGGNILLDIPSSKFRRKRNCAIRAQQPIVIASKKVCDWIYKLYLS